MSDSATKQRLQALVADKRYWNFNHPEHDAYVDYVTGEFRRAYPSSGESENASSRLAANDRGGSGGSVHVQSYTRMQGGQQVAVNDYYRSAPEAGGGASYPSAPVSKDYKSREGKFVGPNNECVDYVKASVPELDRPTKSWKAGPQVKNVDDPPLHPGTALATMPGGSYPQTGERHAVIFDRYGTKDGHPGFVAYEQWAKRDPSPVNPRGRDAHSVRATFFPLDGSRTGKYDGRTYSVVK